jgi:hypothetical protein
MRSYRIEKIFQPGWRRSRLFPDNDLVVIDAMKAADFVRLSKGWMGLAITRPRRLQAINQITVLELCLKGFVKRHNEIPKASNDEADYVYFPVTDIAPKPARHA